MLETTATRSSSSRSCGSINETTLPSAYSCLKFSSARYGLPPPPVPRIQAPMAIDSISPSVTGRIMRGLGVRSGETRHHALGEEAHGCEHALARDVAAAVHPPRESGKAEIFAQGVEAVRDLTRRAVDHLLAEHVLVGD